MCNLGQKIKNLRIENNMTQSDLGNKLFLTDKTISSWENNRTMPDVDMLLKICDAFRISLFNLISDNNASDIETEVKLKVSNLEYIRILNKIKGKSVYLNEEKHYATYYKPLHRKMKNEWLRIRIENNKKVLNYKRKYDNKHCDEYEVIIDNDENLKKILKFLDFKEISMVNKIRTKYLYNNKYEFSFDNVDNLGLFIEIEVKKYDLSPEEEYNNLIKLLCELGIDINLIDTKRYPDYFISEE